MDSKSFKELVKNSSSYTEILKVFGHKGSGGSTKTLRKRLNEEDIDCSHINSTNKGKTFPNRKAIPLEKVMIKNSTYDRGSLKRRLLRDGILENKCILCGQEDIWQGQKLVMILDHINGVHNDHREENIRMLCPNCNSQTPTFAGKQHKKRYNCEKCGREITKEATTGLCHKCSSINQRKVKNRPSKEQLLKEIEETNYCAVGRKYGVSDNAVRKWIK
jgi:Zn finger protein HypA/HybF involved in hydrogenase expression